MCLGRRNEIYQIQNMKPKSRLYIKCSLKELKKIHNHYGKSCLLELEMTLHWKTYFYQITTSSL